jgi:hypothetical protein
MRYPRDQRPFAGPGRFFLDMTVSLSTPDGLTWTRDQSQSHGHPNLRLCLGARILIAAVARSAVEDPLGTFF